MPTTDKFTNQMPCVHITGTKEAWRESPRATLTECAMLNDADTKSHSTEKTDNELLGAGSWGET